jgi:hypothetical protein
MVKQTPNANRIAGSGSACLITARTPPARSGTPRSDVDAHVRRARQTDAGSGTRRMSPLSSGYSLRTQAGTC